MKDSQGHVRAHVKHKDQVRAHIRQSGPYSEAAPGGEVGAGAEVDDLRHMSHMSDRQIQIRTVKITFTYKTVTYKTVKTRSGT